MEWLGKNSTFLSVEVHVVSYGNEEMTEILHRAEDVRCECFATKRLNRIVDENVD